MLPFLCHPVGRDNNNNINNNNNDDDDDDDDKILLRKNLNSKCNAMATAPSGEHNCSIASVNGVLYYVYAKEPQPVSPPVAA